MSESDLRPQTESFFNRRMILVFSLLFLLGGCWLLNDITSENGHSDYKELRDRELFTRSLDLFYLNNQRYPKTALEFDQFMKKWASKPEHRDYNELNSIKVADRSFFNRHVGVHLGWLEYKAGYGISYDDFDKYQNQISLGEIKAPNTDNSRVTVYIQGCQSKMLYSYDESKQNLLVITCRGDRLTGDAIALVEDIPIKKLPFPKKQIDEKSSNKAFMLVHKDTKNKSSPPKKRFSRGISLLIHKDTKKIYSLYFWELERNAGRIKRSETKDWLHVR